MDKTILGALALVFAVEAAEACTGMFAGREATADGSILIGRTVDFSPFNATMRQQVCERGAQISFDGRTNRYRYVCAPKSTSLYAGRYAGSAANEMGVILTGTITGATRPEALANDPFIPVDAGGVGEPNLPDYMIGNAATARQAVDLLAEAVARKGHAGAEIYMVADTNEAWYVEVYSGHDWAAVKMPQDKVAAFGNHFNLRAFDADDSANALHSPTLVSRAVDEGFAVWADDAHARLDLFATYADPDSVFKDFLNFRAWYGHRRFAPSSLPPYSPDLPPDLFYAPDAPLAPGDFFALMRARYEDLSDDDLPVPRTNAAIRVIGTTKQGNCHVLQLDCRPSTPDRMRGTVWSCLGQSEHGVFHPVNAAQNALPDAFTNDAQRVFAYDPARAADAFRRLSALAQADRRFYGPGIRAFWDARERRFLGEWPALIDDAAAADDPAPLSAYTAAAETSSLAAARRLYDELLWYAAANNRIQGDGSGATDEPDAPFAPSLRTTCTGFHETEFGGIRIVPTRSGLFDAGFALGDAVDIRLDSGLVLTNVPIFDGYYLHVNDPVLVCLGEAVTLQRNFGDDVFVEAGYPESAIATLEITLREPGAFLGTQLGLSLAYSDDRSRYPSDAVFANFRAMAGGRLPANLLFRGASPCDNRHNRAPYVDRFLEANAIRCVIDLADAPDRIVAYRALESLDAPFWKALVDRGAVHPHPIKANFMTADYRAGIADALRTILAHDGPYYIHCQEGKDRTGFLCIILEALAGASLDEIERDYMATFANYYAAGAALAPDRYRRIRDIYFGNYVAALAGRPLPECTTENLHAGIRQYLLDTGLDVDTLDALSAKLSGNPS